MWPIGAQPGSRNAGLLALKDSLGTRRARRTASCLTRAGFSTSRSRSSWPARPARTVPGAQATALAAPQLAALVAVPAVGALPMRAFGRPVWRGRMHTWAFVAAIPAGALLITSADHPAARAAAVVYALTLISLFGTSAAYHRLTRSERSRSIMQRVDHAMIYLLIAGTYTPLCVVSLPAAWGVPILAFVGATALIGVVLTLTAFDHLPRISYSLYMVMCWAAIIGGPALFDHLSSVQMLLIGTGSAAYGVGVPVLMRKRPDPWPDHFGYHEIWHLLTIIAAALHFMAIHDVVA